MSNAAMVTNVRYVVIVIHGQMGHGLPLWRKDAPIDVTFVKRPLRTKATWRFTKRTMRKRSYFHVINVKKASHIKVVWWNTKEKYTSTVIEMFSSQTKWIWDLIVNWLGHNFSQIMVSLLMQHVKSCLICKINRSMNNIVLLFIILP